MKTIEGNLLDQSPGVLCHQVNLRGIMGAGIALQIRQKWPAVHDDYVRYCRKGAAVGDVLFSPVRPDLFVANLFGQMDEPVNGSVTNYIAYGGMLEKVHVFAWSRGLPIYLPHGIGCGIAGGTWALMEFTLGNHVPDATLVRYQP